MTAFEESELIPFPSIMRPVAGVSASPAVFPFPITMEFVALPTTELLYPITGTDCPALVYTMPLS